jgi:hypothetical protein
MDDQTADFEVEFVMLASHPESWRSGIRPNHKDPLTGDYFMGALEFHDGIASPGIPTMANVCVLGSQEQLAFVRRFGSWTIWEGSKHAGSVRVIREIEHQRAGPAHDSQLKG